MSKEKEEHILEVVDIVEEELEVKKSNFHAHIGIALGVLSLVVLQYGIVGFLSALIGFIVATRNGNKKSIANKFAYGITVIGIFANLLVIFIYVYLLKVIN